MLKLVTNETIIGTLKINPKNEHSIFIENPMLIMIDRFENKGSFYIGEYLPLSSDATIELFYKDIVTIVNPNQMIIKTYNDILSSSSVKEELKPKFH